MITSIIHREVAEGSFSIANFYQRRVRRIAPALLIVLGVTLAAGVATLLPRALESLARSALGALGMVANIFFWRVSGYFALAQGVTPLLHTWSLGVEEQFYLFFPVALILLERWKVSRPAIVAVALLSFALCIYGTAIAPSAAFYLLPTRAWELMLGALLAIGVVRISGAAGKWLSPIGMAMIIGAAVFLKSSAAFPGWIAAVPAVGAMLVIGSGPDAPGNRMIANNAFVWIGRISYSLYLWHWPIFAFSRQYLSQSKLPPAWAIGGLVLSVCLAWATYRWLEQPPRRSGMPFRRVAAITGGAGAAIVATVMAIVATNGLPVRFDQRVLELAKVADDHAPLSQMCVNTALDQIDESCHLGKKGRPEFVLWGDSHAAAISEGVGLGAGRPAVLASMNSCAPALGWTSSESVGRDAPTCRARNEALLRRVLADPSLRQVFLAAYWPSHQRDGGEQFLLGVQKLVDRLRSADKHVFVVAGTPEPGVNVPEASAMAAQFGRTLPRWACPRPSVSPKGAAVIDLSQDYCAAARPETLFVDGNHPSRAAGIGIIGPGVRLALLNSGQTKVAAKRH